MTIDLYLKHLTEVGNAATPGKWKNDMGNGEIETEKYRILICKRVGNYERKLDAEEMYSGPLNEEIKKLLSFDNEMDMEFIATARNEWNTLLEINRKLLGAIESIEEFGCNSNSATGCCTSANGARAAIAECEALVKERE